MTTYRWAVEWRADNKLDGRVRHFMWNHNVPWLFNTRREASEHIAEKYGDIAYRLDLRAEPHGWRMPRAVRVAVTLRAVGAKKGRAK